MLYKKKLGKSKPVEVGDTVNILIAQGDLCEHQVMEVLPNDELLVWSKEFPTIEPWVATNRSLKLRVVDE